MPNLPPSATSLAGLHDGDPLPDAGVVAALGESLRPLAIALYRCGGAGLFALHDGTPAAGRAALAPPV